MRKKLIYNYWLIIIAWCMFLNDLTLLAIICGLLACGMLVYINRRVNYWRMAFATILSYVAISLFLLRFNISYFFPRIHIFLAVISLDLSLTNERLYLFKSKYLKPFLAIMLISLSVLSIIVLVLPNDLYTLFTKPSLYAMICLIFLPYLVPMSICICRKEVLYKNTKHTAIQTQRIIKGTY